MEQILINGTVRLVPPEVEAAGRPAIAAWHKAQLATAKPTTTKPAADAAKE